MFRVRALVRPIRNSRTFHSFRPRHVFRIPVIPFAAASITTMAPVPAQQSAEAVHGSAAELHITEPKAGGEKSARMHSQVVIIGSGPAGHT
jgi:hypothetical protein